jgi:hypothetical protein
MPGRFEGKKIVSAIRIKIVLNFEYKALQFHKVNKTQASMYSRWSEEAFGDLSIPPERKVRAPKFRLR